MREVKIFVTNLCYFCYKITEFNKA